MSIIKKRKKEWSHFFNFLIPPSQVDNVDQRLLLHFLASGILGLLGEPGRRKRSQDAKRQNDWNEKKNSQTWPLYLLSMKNAKRLNYEKVSPNIGLFVWYIRYIYPHLTPTIVWALDEVAFMLVLATVRFTCKATFCYFCVCIFDLFRYFVFFCVLVCGLPNKSNI